MKLFFTVTKLQIIFLFKLKKMETILLTARPTLYNIERKRKKVRGVKEKEIKTNNPLYAHFLNTVSEQRKSEFIDGEIVIQSPAKVKHIDANTSLTILLKLHIEKNKLGWLASEKALIKMRHVRNDYEPDICFFNTDKSEFFKRNTWQFPIPDLSIEILSDSTEHIDRGRKFRDYANHNVREYWIVNTDRYEIEQYCLKSTGIYTHNKTYGMYDTIKSFVVEGFQAPVNAVFFYDDLDDFLFGTLEKRIERHEDELELRNRELKRKNKKIEQQRKELVQKDMKMKEKDRKIKEDERKMKEDERKMKEKDRKLEQQQREQQQQHELIKKLQKQIKDFKLWNK